jgi:hydrogenase expression/formation protein HypD
VKFIDEYRDPSLAEQLLERIRRRSSRTWTIMEVCGGQTHGLLRHGIDQELRSCLELLHGPGCPVCVTPAQAIDQVIELALRPKTRVATFGDMLRVPGSRLSMLQARGAGASIHMVYSPLDAVKMAQDHPSEEVVFFAVGFETTAPATALAVWQAASAGLRNFSILAAHVRVLPAMEAIARAEDCRVHGFLAAGHVCTITGYDRYHDFARRFQMPVVVTGFEPVDLLQGIDRCVQLLESGQVAVVNAYARSVQAGGNAQAQAIVERVFQIADQSWRGLGWMPGGGLRLQPDYWAYDAERKFQLTVEDGQRPEECRSGEVMIGKIRPPECPHFGKRCTPQSPLGAPMVSSEGACSAYYRYATGDANIQPLRPSC